MGVRHSKSRFFCAVKTLVSRFGTRKSAKISLKTLNMCETWRRKTGKGVKMHKFLVCPCKSQYFAQSQKFFAQSHGCETMTFRNSGGCWLCYYTIFWLKRRIIVYLNFVLQIFLKNGQLFFYFKNLNKHTERFCLGNMLHTN